MNIGKIGTGGVYRPGDVSPGGTPRAAGKDSAAKPAALSVGTSRADPLAETPVTDEVEADLRRDDDIGRLFRDYRYPVPELKS